MSIIFCRISRRNGVAGTQQRKDCLRVSIASKSDINERQMGEDSTHASSFNSIDMAAAIESIKTYLSHYLSAGQTVHLDGIGSFQLSLGLKKMAGADEKVSARQVEVKGITFRPAASFMTQVTKDMHLFITEDTRDIVSQDDALHCLRDFVARCRAQGQAELINVQRLSALFNCSESTARNRVKQFVEEGYLAPAAGIPHYYVPGANLEERIG